MQSLNDVLVSPCYATHRFNSLEGQLFRNAREAERAAIRLASRDLKLVA